MSAQGPLQAVTFSIGAEVFAVPVEQVREILDYQESFRLPGAPAHFLGLIDVRGVGVPTIDLRLRLGLPRAEPTPLTRILILEVMREGRIILLGLVIDRALVVSAFARESIENAPDIGIRWRSDYITGVIRQNGNFVVLIDMARVLTSQDAAMIDQSAGEAWEQAS
ncbi:chemotaxis protein CheW [Novosphingobium sp. KACC 22771]|uniref:chemotaxis protein CheW n=1 Tax=Novosphingobium sp. KACC 22771 TaxID=3025670 RepID=UPI0023669CAA|nr:chemotaxis protein CheW [Novosphingobium sp. KACC 22771]WDF71729.1 chemotaxis protein CheW [Novosphingobium sp. KACC 22771]